MLKNKRKALFFGIAVSVAIIAVMVLVLSLYSSSETARRERQNEQMIMQATGSITDTVRIYFEQEHETLLNMKKYIEESSMTFDQAMTFLDMADSSRVSAYQIIDCTSFEGCSLSDNGGTCPVNYIKNYGNLHSVFSEISSGSIDNSLINTSSSFTSPITGKQSIAFYTDLMLENMDSAALMCVISLDSLVGAGLPVPPYENAGGAIINSIGDYMVKTSAFKSENIFEYFRAYSGLTYSRAEEVRNEVNEAGRGLLMFKNSAGKDCFYAYERINGTNGFFYFSSVSRESVKGENMDFAFIGMFMTFILLMVIIDMRIIHTLYVNLRRSLENESKAREQAENANRAKSDFLSRMSHEIRSPLNAVIGYNSIARTTIENKKGTLSFEMIGEKVSSCLTKSDIASRHLIAVINDVLDMSSIESGKMKVVNELFDFKELILPLTTVFYSMARSKGVDFAVVFDTPADEKLIGDQMRINQILTNLLSNAVKFTHDGGRVTLNVRQEDIDSDSVMTCFSVTDTGIGMDVKALDSIWAPFEQADSSISRNFGGTGLGLSITKNLVTMLGGEITVESTAGAGSVFSVKLKLKRSKQSNKISLYDFSQLYALIMDGDENTCGYLEIMLERIGVRCKKVCSGSEAVEAVRQSHALNDDFTMCLMDWEIPEFDGSETLRLIHEITDPDFPILIATAYDCTDIENEARSAGVTRFISKPIFQSTLFDMLVDIAGKGERSIEQTDTELRFDGTRIILAEDNKMNMEISCEILRSRGFAVDIAWNGLEAVNLFESSAAGTYKAILIDIRMPVMDGHTATKSIRGSSHPDAKAIPIIAMTADAFTENIDEAFASGMTDHIAKPINISELMNSLKHHISRTSQ